VDTTAGAGRPQEPGGRAAIPARVFVGNLSFVTTPDALSRLLSEAGNVVDVYLPTDRETGRPRGFAFVQFASEADATEAIRLFHEREVDGRKLTVNLAGDRPPPGSRPGGGRPWEGVARPGGADRPPKGRSFKRKGSRRGLRGRKRSL
jgi:RNA recognition motif-containing protein